MEPDTQGQPEDMDRLSLPMYVEGYDDGAFPVLCGYLSQGEGENRKESEIGFYFPLPDDLIEKTLDQCGLDRNQPINLNFLTVYHSKHEI